MAWLQRMRRQHEQPELTSTYTKAVSMGHQLCQSAQPCGWSAGEQGRERQAHATQWTRADGRASWAAPWHADQLTATTLTRNCKRRPRKKAAASPPSLQASEADGAGGSFVAAVEGGTAAGSNASLLGWQHIRTHCHTHNRMSWMAMAAVHLAKTGRQACSAAEECDVRRAVPPGAAARGVPSTLCAAHSRMVELTAPWWTTAKRREAVLRRSSDQGLARRALGVWSEAAVIGGRDFTGCFSGREVASNTHAATILPVCSVVGHLLRGIGIVIATLTARSDQFTCLTSCLHHVPAALLEGRSPRGRCRCSRLRGLGPGKY